MIIYQADWVNQHVSSTPFEALVPNYFFHEIKSPILAKRSKAKKVSRQDVLDVICFRRKSQCLGLPSSK
ncbi:hypothetical protein RRG08_008991 [Elysia crispata]|uniref:Uncharacterized protein n=1 Tax=Elysia crispata TaxID=231223 RepID=A0AAE0YUW2_9GAST|nr:hypothetical protein RRG08_008991 [Elysia crispata]